MMIAGMVVVSLCATWVLVCACGRWAASAPLGCVSARDRRKIRWAVWHGQIRRVK